MKERGSQEMVLQICLLILRYLEYKRANREWVKVSGKKRKENLTWKKVQWNKYSEIKEHSDKKIKKRKEKCQTR